MRITISGPPGSGKTTVCKLLGERLHLEVVISGSIFRQMAKENNMSLADFGKMCEFDPEADKRLDERMVAIARGNDNIILEGRLTAHMLARNDIPAFKVLLDADLDVRAERVVEREGGTKEQRKQEIVAREECEAKRYMAFYGIDIADRKVYDLIIDTTYQTPQQIADRICAGAEGRDG